MPNLPKSDAIASTKTKGTGKGKGKGKSRLATSSTTASNANANAEQRTAVDAKQTAAETEETKDFTHAYAEDLRADIYTDVNANPKAKVHTVEWNKIMIGACVCVWIARAFEMTDETRLRLALDELVR